MSSLEVLGTKPLQNGKLNCWQKVKFGGRAMVPTQRKMEGHLEQLQGGNFRSEQRTVDQ